jgi:ribonuclease R
LPQTTKSPRSYRANPKRADVQPGAAPSRDEILAFLSGAPAAGGVKLPARVTKRDVARAFGVKGEAKTELKLLIKDLEADDAITRGRKVLQRQGRLPAMVVADIIEKDRDGEMIARPADWSEAGDPPRVRVRMSKHKRERGPAPGMGARVLLRIDFDAEAEGRTYAYSGRVVKIIDPAKPRALGVYRQLENGAGRVLPIEKRGAALEIFIPNGMQGEAKEGELVGLEMLREGRFGLHSARVVERLGAVDTERAVSLIALAHHDIPHVFSAAALREAEAARPATFAKREDWRDLPLLTIDPVDAKDHDDAVHAAPDADPGNPGGFVISVAIADVAYCVTPGSMLDKEALERGNSVYFPDRVVPMLPERISNDLCSLRPLEDRPALAVRIIVGADGRKRRHSFHRVTMRSAAKLSYEQAQRAIDGAPDSTTQPLLEGALKPLYSAYEALKKERGERDPLDLDLPERKLILDAEGKLKGVRWPERLDAHRLIEEFMILANVAAAETLEAAHSPLIYRAHDSPSEEKIGDLSEFLATLGVKLAKGERMRPAHFNRVLSRVKGEPAEALINEVVLRAQSQAEYTHENYGHFGLNLRRYAHFTSPIRRYADLIVHRALISALRLGTEGLEEGSLRELGDIAERISAAERRAMAAERETMDRLIAAHMSSQIGAHFSARISGVTKVGLFVKLTETGADGFIPAASLGADYFRFEEASRSLVGTRSGERFRLGDAVEVKLLEAAPFAGALRFEMLSRGGGRNSLPRGKKERRR